MPPTEVFSLLYHLSGHLFLINTVLQNTTSLEHRLPSLVYALSITRHADRKYSSDINTTEKRISAHKYFYIFTMNSVPLSKQHKLNIVIKDNTKLVSIMNLKYYNQRFILILIVFLLCGASATAQEKLTTEEAFLSQSDTLPKHIRDSIKIEELSAMVQELKLKEIVLQNLTDSNQKNAESDSLHRVAQRRQIDSLRQITPGVPIIIEGDTLLKLYARRGGTLAKDRALKAEQLIMSLGKRLTANRDSIEVFKSEFQNDIMSGETVIISITDQDALWQNTTRDELSEQYRVIIQEKIDALQDTYGLTMKIKQAGLFLLVIIIQAVLIYFTNRVFRRMHISILRFVKTKFKAVSIKNYEFLDIRKQSRIVVFLIKSLRLVVIVIQLLISIPILFSIFPETEDLAYTLFSYAWNPIKDMFILIINYVPSLFKIGLIYICFRYIIKTIRYFATEIATGKLKINGFYPDWAYSTFYIIRTLLYSFMIIMIWPLLPGSSSPIFQGVSVFVGLILSLGSTSVIGNLMAGLVITYMRPFKVGDQIKLNDTTGNVIEKTPLVTRIKTPKNEVVTIPNSFIMSSQTVNYTKSASNYGLILHTKIAVGYEVHWKEIHKLLIEAAHRTEGVLKHPAPFVLEVELADSYCQYQINAYTRDSLKMAKMYSDLHQNVIDVFNEAGVEMLAPLYYAHRNGKDVTIPMEYNMKKKKDDDNESSSRFE